MENEKMKKDARCRCAGDCERCKHKRSLLPVPREEQGVHLGHHDLRHRVHIGQPGSNLAALHVGAFLNDLLGEFCPGW